MPDTFERLKAALADRYAIERELGSGGMATVYLAEDLKLHRKVAVKVLRPDLAATLVREYLAVRLSLSKGRLWQLRGGASSGHPVLLPTRSRRRPLRTRFQ